MEMGPIINGGIAFAVVLVLMVLNIPIGIAMLLVGFTGFALISGFDPAIFVLGTAPFDAVSKYTLSVLPLFVLMGNLAIVQIYQEIYMMLLTQLLVTTKAVWQCQLLELVLVLE